MSGKNGQKLLRGSVTFGGKKYYVSGYSKEEIAEKRAEKLRMLEEGTLDPKNDSTPVDTGVAETLQRRQGE